MVVHSWHPKLTLFDRGFTLAVCALLLCACGGGGSTLPVLPPTAAPPPPPPVSSAPELSFSELTNSVGVQHSFKFSDDFMEDPKNFAGGAAAGDIDGDDDIDLFIVRGNVEKNLLLVNEGGIFVDRSDGSGLALPDNGTANVKLSGPVLADMDGDGDLDIFVGGLQADPSFIFRNNGDLTFTDVTNGSGIDLMTSKNTISAAFGDYDGDGDLDLAMAHWGTPRQSAMPGETETLWRNDSDSTRIQFTPVSAAAGISEALALDLRGVLGPDHDYTFAPNFADINKDGHLDLLSVSDFRGSQVFINKGDGTFDDATDRTQITDTNGMGAAVGDFNNDQDLDWFVSSIQGNRLYENVDGTYIEIAGEAGVGNGGWGWAACFADFDLDGLLDIYHTNGWINDTSSNPQDPYTSDRSRLFMSNGDGTFSEQATAVGIDDQEQGRGVICADFDNDLDVDILLLINENEKAALYWRNTINNANALSISLNGSGKNTAAIGARIFATVGDTTQMRQISIGSNFTTHNPARAVFGFGEATQIDELRILWPDGEETLLSNVSTGQALTISHPGN